MSSMFDHCPDAEKISNGVKLPLFNSDGGISDDYIMVRWGHSDAVRAVMDDMKRRLADELVMVTSGMSAKEKKEAERKNRELTDELALNARCSQVAGWSFKEKPTKTNVYKFLKARPDIADRIDAASADTTRFFSKSGGNS